MAILPAGSFNTSKRVYTAFKVGDVVEGGVEKVTRGLWSGNVGTLTTFLYIFCTIRYSETILL